MKIVVDDKIPYIQPALHELADVVVAKAGSAITAADVRDADILLVRTRTRCSRELLEGSRVRLVVTATIGYDHLDTAYLDARGIEWHNCPGCNATSVAQYVRNSLLVLAQAGRCDLAGATVGIVGVGHVGTAVAEALDAIGVRKILLNDPPRTHPLPLSLPGGERIVSQALDASRPPLSPDCSATPHDLPLPALLREASGARAARAEWSSLSRLQTACDVITFHTPLTADGPYPTLHLADEAFFQGLRRQPVIINAARGGVVDEGALLRALDAGRVSDAVIDTWEGEPDVNRELLRRAIIATPHIAGYSADGKANATRMTLEAVCRFLGVDPPTNAPCLPRGEDATPPPYTRKGAATSEAERGEAELRLYDPRRDSDALKAQPGQFEYLRGHYPMRREQA